MNNISFCYYYIVHHPDTNSVHLLYLNQLNLYLSNQFCLSTRKNASDDGYYNDHFVMQHDLLRELIIHQSMSEPVEWTKRLIIDISGNKFPKWWSEKKKNPIHARLLSISTGCLSLFSSRTLRCAYYLIFTFLPIISCNTGHFFYR